MSVLVSGGDLELDEIYFVAGKCGALSVLCHNANGVAVHSAFKGPGILLRYQPYPASFLLPDPRSEQHQTMVKAIHMSRAIRALQEWSRWHQWLYSPCVPFMSMSITHVRALT